MRLGLRLMSQMSTSKCPLIVVAGETGTGKSSLAVSLAVDLARSCNSSAAWTSAEIVNADSMQVYRGLDVLTNKATLEEMRGIRHHLMSFAEPGDEYRVGKFAEDAQREIDRMHGWGVLPIVAGGTAYYAQSLLFPEQLVGDGIRDEAQTSSKPASTAHIDPTSTLGRRLATLSAVEVELLCLLPSLPNISTVAAFAPGFPVDRLPTRELHDSEVFAATLYSMLQTLDPVIAAKWHWRDLRKVRRCLEICLAEGKPASEVWDEQRTGDGPASTRYRTLLFWLYADRQLLDRKLDARVDTMIQRGIIDEVKDLRQIEQRLKADQSTSVAQDVDFSSGIFQAIGYRELSGYLSPPCTCCGPPENHQRLDTDEARLAHAVDRTKISTRQYARRQSSWLRRKLLPAVVDSDVLVYPLDCSTAPFDRAYSVLQAFLRGDPMPLPTEVDPGAAAILSAGIDEAKGMVRCDACSDDPARPFMVAASALKAHQGSAAHRKRVQRTRVT